VSGRAVELRQPESNMLTFTAATQPSLETFYDAIVELLIERLNADLAKEQEIREND
jgi:hypothetical protein